MNAIIGFTNLAKRSAGDKGATLSYLAKIDQSSNHLLGLINDILDMSRIESGSVVLEPADEDLSDILRSVCDILRVEIEEKDLEFSLDVCRVRNDHVVCDRLRLTQVLMNILSNAVKYTPAGGKIQLTVTQGERLADGSSLYEFRVRDNGIGMSEDFARTVFEPFTRERSSTLSGVQGTGLGMSVAKAAVDMMGGSILCRSRQGEGTLFVVKVPLKAQTGRAEEAIKPPAVLGAPRGARGAGAYERACDKGPRLLR